jgi:hypothetical protein
VAIGLLVVVFGIGAVPGVAAATAHAAARFSDRPGYAAVVLHGQSPPSLAVANPDLGVTAVGLGLASALGATLLALAVAAGRATRANLGGRLAGVLRRLHAGRLTDSAAWITFGAAAIGATLALGLR